MSAASKLAHQLNCPAVVADDLVNLGGELAQTFIRLRVGWNIDLVIEAKRVAAICSDQNHYTDENRHWQKHLEPHELALHVRSNLADDVRALFDTFEAANQVLQRLYRAHQDLDAYGVEIQGSVVTFVLQFLHQHDQLSDPAAVVEGRILFDAMQNDRPLLDGVAAL